MASDQNSLLINAIKHAQELRSSVSHVFETLSNGATKTKEDENSQKTFLNKIQQALLSVNNDMR